VSRSDHLDVGEILPDKNLDPHTRETVVTRRASLEEKVFSTIAASGKAPAGSMMESQALVTQARARPSVHA